VYTTRESIVFSGNTLVRNFEKLVALVEEILLQPRWDEVELARVKTATINDIMRSNANPNVVARNVWNKLLYGEGHPFAYPTSGTVESVESITIDDLKAFYEKNFSPSISRFLVVGKIDQDQVVASLNSLESNWSAKEVTIPEFPVDTQRGKSTLAFVDIPNAKQSVINIGYLSMARDNPDFYPAEVMNYKLGGSFSGNVNMILREEKGYTYGARTSFSGTKTPGTFKASSSVRTNTTGESVAIFREQIEKYKEGITEEELDFTKNALVKSNARRFETQRALLEMLSEMSNYGLAPDYIKNEEAIAKGMTLEMHKELANKLLDENRMLYLVVGDAATQFAQFKDMGL
jgi:zinc protease